MTIRGHRLTTNALRDSMAMAKEKDNAFKAYGISFTPEQIAELKDASDKTGVPSSRIVRECLAYGLGRFVVARGGCRINENRSAFGKPTF